MVCFNTWYIVFSMIYYVSQTNVGMIFVEAWKANKKSFGYSILFVTMSRDIFFTQLFEGYGEGNKINTITKILVDIMNEIKAWPDFIQQIIRYSA